MTDPFAAEAPFGPEDGATPLSIDERQGLIPASIGLRRELNAAEQANIAKAHARLFGRRKPMAPMRVIEEAFLKRVHRTLYRDVWRWAGDYRRSDKNIGVGWHEIPVVMRGFCSDAAAWLQRAAYGPDELAVRFHHRLVSIHPFPNGNGRHARTMADLLILGLGEQRFSWGSGLGGEGDVRARYIAALRAADDHVIAPLVAFARS